MKKEGKRRHFNDLGIFFVVRAIGSLGPSVW
jgi:hypothetical protein